MVKGFTVLAPMEDVTDTVFRQIINRIGRPEVFVTEFVNVDAIEHEMRLDTRKDRARIDTSGFPAHDFAGVSAPLKRLCFTKSEKPIWAQIWGTNPENFCRSAKVIKSLGFDGIDINMGCPVREVLKIGAGGGLVGKNSLVAEIIAATKEGAEGLPVSVKTRIGNKTIITEEWIGFLLEQKLSAITVHGRMVLEKSDVPAHWDEIGKAVKLRDAAPFHTLIVGNGDIKSLVEVREMVDKYGVDGVMIGRGVFANPWVFAGREGSREERFELLRQHLKLWEETWAETRNFAIMKKFVKMYVNGFAGASELRVKLMGCKSGEEMLKLLADEKL